MFNGKNHNKTITFLYIICVVFSPWIGYNISKKTEMFSYIRFTMYAKETLYFETNVLRNVYRITLYFETNSFHNVGQRNIVEEWFCLTDHSFFDT